MQIASPRARLQVLGNVTVTDPSIIRKVDILLRTDEIALLDREAARRRTSRAAILRELIRTPRHIQLELGT